jgi:hypothetical protein
MINRSMMAKKSVKAGISVTNDSSQKRGATTIAETSAASPSKEVKKKKGQSY